MSHNAIDDRVVGDFDYNRFERENAKADGTRRDPAGPNPETNKEVTCSVCGQTYNEHMIRFKHRGGLWAWYCKTKTCEGQQIGGDLTYTS